MNVVAPLVISHLLVAIALAFLPISSRYRPAVVGIVAANSVLSLGFAEVKTWWGLQYAEYAFGFLLCANCFLCLCQIAPPEGADTRQKIKFGLIALFNSRMNIETRGLPQFSKTEPNYVPSRLVFLLNRGWAATWTMTVFILLQKYPLSLWPDDFESPKTHILRRILEVSPREWVILFYLSFECWLDSYCLLKAAHSVASVIAVACGDEPKNWRPLFGSIKDAYTVQRFFGLVRLCLVLIHSTQHDTSD